MEQVTLSGIPDTDRIILDKLDNTNLHNICLASSSVQSSCNKSYIRSRMIRDFVSDYTEYKPEKISYLEQYFT